MKKKYSADKNQHLKMASSLLKETIVVFEKKFWALIAIAFLLAVLPFLTQIFLLGALPLIAHYFPQDSKMFLVISITASVVMSCLNLFLQLWTLKVLIIKADQNSADGFFLTYKKAWRNIGQFFWSVVFFISIVVLGFIFFAVPGIIAAFWFCLAAIICAVEQKKGIESLAASYILVKKSWRTVLLFLSYLVAISMTVTILISFLKIANPTRDILTNTLFCAFFATGLCVLHAKLTLDKNLQTIEQKTFKTISWVAKISLAALAAITVAVISAGIYFKDDIANLAAAQITKEALQNYKQKNGSYPLELSSLAPDYLPQNLLNADIVYKPSPDKNTFEIIVNFKHLKSKTLTQDR